jgi:hypothetical protein
MILDAQTQLSSAQAVTASAVSANTIDLGTARDVANGDELHVAITVDVAAAAAGAATVTFQAITSASANLSTPTVIAQTDAIGKADLPAGRRPIILTLSRHVLASLPIGQRYLGLNYLVGTGPLTTGSFTASVVTDPQDVARNYASGFSIT